MDPTSMQGHIAQRRERRPMTADEPDHWTRMLIIPRARDRVATDQPVSWALAKRFAQSLANWLGTQCRATDQCRARR